MMLTVMIVCIVAMGITASAVTISDEGRLPFEDVKENYWYNDATEFCYANDIINGMNDYTFDPNGKLTRAQFVMMLANVEEVDLSMYSVKQFQDVKASHWYYGAVAWAYENNIVSGTSTNKFSPNMQLNRETLSRIMTLYMQSKGYNVTVDHSSLDKYTDKDKISSWAVDGMRYMVSAGIVSGMTENTIVPKGVVTRAQAARILMVFLQDYHYGVCEHVFSVADCTNPAICSECGMVNGLPNGHVIGDYPYNCIAGGICDVCGDYPEPSKFIHDFRDADCFEPKTCNLCGTTRGKAKGHTWKAATCTENGKCNDCYMIKEYALGHTTNNGVCSRCKKEFFPTVRDKAIYYIKSKGKYDSKANEYYVYSRRDLSGNDYIETYLVYDGRGITIGNFYNYAEGDIGYTTLTELNNSNISFNYIYSDDYYGKVFDGSGTLSPWVFTRNSTVQFFAYSGTYTSVVGNNLNVGIHSALDMTEDILDWLYGGSLADLGYLVY